jgi:hypothetical protein
MLLCRRCIHRNERNYYKRDQRRRLQEACKRDLAVAVGESKFIFRLSNTIFLLEVSRPKVKVTTSIEVW